ncbi:MAG: hypothetical protein IJ743_04935 [Bacilli bacterium]|nr:hypothetical protein [Bacilli bacterium]
MNDSNNELNNLANKSLEDLKDDGVLNDSNAKTIHDDKSLADANVGTVSLAPDSSAPTLNSAEVESSNSIGSSNSNSTGEELNFNQVVNNNTTISNGDAFVSPKKKGNKLWIVVVIILFVAIVGIWAYEFLFVRNSKRVISSSVSHVFDLATNTLTDIENNSLNFDIKNDVLKSSGTIQLDTNFEGLKDLSKVVFNYGADVDLKNEKVYVSLGASENSKDIILGKMYFNSDRITLDSNVFSNPYYVDLDEALDFSSIKEAFNEIPMLQIQDSKVLVEKVKNAILNTMDEKKMKNQSEKVVIRGKEEEVLAHVYTIDSNEFKRLAKAVLESLSEDDTLSILATASGSSKDAVKSSLDKAIKELDKDENNNKEDQLVIKVYADSLFGAFRGFSVSAVDESQDEAKEVFSFSYVTNGSQGNFFIRTTNNTDCSSGYLVDCVRETTSSEFEGTVDYDASKNSYAIHFNRDDMDYDVILSGKESNSKSVELKMQDDSHNFVVSFVMNSSKSGNTMDGKINLAISYKDDTNDFQGSLHLNTSTTIGGAVEEVPKNATNIETMTAEEAETILSTLLENLSNSSLKSIGDILGSMLTVEDNYDYDYDYDDFYSDLDFSDDLDYELDTSIS